MSQKKKRTMVIVWWYKGVEITRIKVTDEKFDDLFWQLGSQRGETKISTLVTKDQLNETILRIKKSGFQNKFHYVLAEVIKNQI